MQEPDYIICLECDSPNYTFDWDGTRITDAICTTCGNSKATLFTTEEAYGEMMSLDDRYYGSSDD